MVRVVHREQAEISMDYVNQPDGSTRNGSGKRSELRPAAGEKLIRVVAVSFGLLCVLQAAANITLRLVLHTQTSDKDVTVEIDKLRRLYDQYFQQGWVYLHPSFYYISTTEKSWQASRDDCLQRDADLVIINTKEEQDLTRQFQRLTWIGLRNETITRQWTWVDGTPLTKSYWGPGEPNALAGDNEYCVEIRFKKEDSWNDRLCSAENFWICEKNVTQKIK
ncbi:CD209 antigen-like protein E [Kryptolebias marmoratus]|uniref:CD209 antigen-like protein E n=1 Tax=Kryptolebias marmoratus TaxID=37003 RepID=UPI0007F871B1|nr:CD209 antigen-like protein E [Kryptolebias marmoratus]